MSRFVGPDETVDILCQGRIEVIQKKAGYRFSIDAILLANFVRTKKHERVLDIGTGCGIIPIYMSRKGCQNEMVGVEIQKDLYEVALKNKMLSSCSNVTYLHDDIKSCFNALKKTPFHVVISNPPYTAERTGRQCPVPSRLVARHESHLSLSDLTSISSALLYKKGRFYVIYPSRRLASSSTLHVSPVGAKAVAVPCIPRKEKGSNLFLAEFMKEGGMGTTVENPLHLRETGGIRRDRQQLLRLRKELEHGSDTKLIAERT